MLYNSEKPKKFTTSAAFQQVGHLKDSSKVVEFFIILKSYNIADDTNKLV